MHFDYGYIEEGKLGKVYDIKLIKRFFSFVIKYKRACLVAATVNLLTILFELVPPYLSKIIVDDYILPRYCIVDISKLSPEDAQYILSKSHIKIVNKHDLTGLHVKLLQDLPITLNKSLKERNALLDERYFLAKGKGEKSELLIHQDSHLLPSSQVKTIPKRDLLNLRNLDLRAVYFLTVILGLVTIFGFYCSHKEYYTLEFISQNVTTDIREKLSNHIMSQNISFFEEMPTGKLVTRITNDVENLNEMFKSVFATALKDIVLISGILSILFYLNLKLAFVMLLFIPIVLFLAMRFSFKAREVFRMLRNSISKLNSFLQERIRGIRVIKIFCQEKNQEGLFEEINNENYKAGMNQIVVFALFMPIMELLSSVAIASLLYFGMYQVFEERVTIGGLVAFISYVQMIFRPIRDISEKYTIMQAGMASLERIFELLDRDSKEISGGFKKSSLEGDIVFEGVHFGYGNGEVIKDISFHVPPKGSLAIVGPTGAGKSTLIGLMEGFYEPSRGKIYVDGVELKQWDKSSLRLHIGLCQQEVFIFSGNLRENITLGRDLKDEQVEKSLKLSGGWLLLNRLPDGLDTFLEENGRNLSSGERQLLAFARAIAGDPKVLILDEATSSVDPETEKVIQEGMKEMLKSRTSIIIAHRLSTIKSAKEIIFVKDGMIVERGDEKELLKINGLYSMFYHLQEILPKLGWKV